MEITLRPEEERDYRLVEHITREAFWNVYKPGCDEHFILHNLRGAPSFIRELDYVAEADGEVAGNIVYSRGTVADAAGTAHEVIGFGPVSVLPALQGRGIGARLIRHTLGLAREAGHRGVIIFGNPAYYHRFGFENAARFGITTADGANFDAFMALELRAGGLDGITGRFLEDPVFRPAPAALEAYDRGFPAREKLVTDTQLKP